MIDIGPFLMIAYKWFKNNENWNKEHQKAWLGYFEADDGFTLFQKECLKAFENQVQNDGIEIKGEAENYYTGYLNNTKSKFFIYLDGAEISGDNNDSRLEQCDYKSPKKLIDSFIEECLKLKVI